MRFLGHQSRDARVIHTDDRANISNDNTSIHVRSDGVVYDTDANLHYYSPDSFAMASDNYRASGIHMVGPNDIADQGGTRTLYRVMANGHAHNDHIDISFGFARSPASITLAAAGNLVTKRVYLAGGSSLQYDDIIAVDPFPAADAAKAICFFVYLHNTSTAGQSTHTEFSFSVARLVGARPMMHDQRIQ